MKYVSSCTGFISVITNLKFWVFEIQSVPYKSNYGLFFCNLLYVLYFLITRRPIQKNHTHKTQKHICKCTQTHMHAQLSYLLRKPCHKAHSFSSCTVNYTQVCMCAHVRAHTHTHTHTHKQMLLRSPTFEHGRIIYIYIYVNLDYDMFSKHLNDWAIIAHLMLKLKKKITVHLIDAETIRINKINLFV
jgi:hypothetical protein